MTYYATSHRETFAEILNWLSVLLHNDGFRNDSITKRCLCNSTNVSHNDLVSLLLYDTKINEIKNIIFCHFLNTISFLLRGKIVSTKSVFGEAAVAKSTVT